MTQKYALIGESLNYSLSPEIHGFMFDALSVDATYERMEVAKDHFGNPEFLASISKLDGFNVTIPYKEKIIPFLNEISEAARHIGAVNTVKVQNGILMGYNTDYDGFVSVLNRTREGKVIKSALVLGTGGAAKMVVYALKEMKVDRITLASRDALLARAKFPDVDCCTYESVNQNDTYYDLLVNCTPVGHIGATKGECVETAKFKDVGFIFDMNYNPAETHYLACGKKFDVQGVNGYDMLIAQAIRADHIWLNVDLDIATWTMKFKQNVL